MFFLLVIQNLTDLGNGGIDRSVDHFVLVAVLVPHFAGRGFQPSTDRCFTLGIARPQALFQFVHSAGMNEQRNRIEFVVLQNRQGTLDIDLQNNPLSPGQARGNLISQGSVPVSEAENLLALQEFAGLASSREFIAIRKK